MICSLPSSPGTINAYRTYLQASARTLSLMSLPDNWNGYGDKKTERTAVRQALRVLEMLSRRPGQAHALDKTDVVPTSEGGIQLEWHNGHGDTEIEIHHDGAVSLFMDCRAEQFENTFGGVDEALAAMIETAATWGRNTPPPFSDLTRTVT